MNGAHLHLILNHLPVIGLVFAIALLAWGMFSCNEALKKAGLAALVAVALLAIPAFLTGEPAEDIAQSLPGVAHSIVEQHEDAAKTALVASLVAGFTATIGLWRARGKAATLWCSAPALLLALVAAGLMAWTANLGGNVRHTEIRITSASIPTHSD